MMNRRQALKSIGLGTGALVVGPTTLSLLQGCKGEPTYEWQPVFLSAANGYALQQVLDVIIPKTDTPGAKELNLAKFIDSYMEEVADKETGGKFRNTADAFNRAFKEQFDKEPGEGSPEEYEMIVARYLKADEDERQVFKKRLTATQDPQDKDPQELMDSDAGAYSYLEQVRGMGIWGWKTSESVGENVLWYDPVPGEYIACAAISELGNGKAMSL